MTECTTEITYEEQAILNWHRARKAYIASGDSSVKVQQKRLNVFRATEEVLVAIGRDLNIGNA